MTKTNTKTMSAHELWAEQQRRAGCLLLAYATEPRGVLVGLYEAGPAGLDVNGDYATACETHGTLCGHSKRGQAIRSVLYPHNWCDACRAERALNKRLHAAGWSARRR